MIDPTPVPDERILITRVFDAPRDRVFAAWTTAEHWARWYGPDGCTISNCTLDARPGGRLHFQMFFRGKDLWEGGTFREVVAPERLVYTLSFHDEAGNVVPARTYGLSDQFPLESLVTVTFVERNGKTVMTIEHVVSLDVPERAGMYIGWSEGFNRMEALLANR
ncbi:MAG: SRPBCC domain-containing protein [Vulcanimicrobiaceae bacterium]